jgi:hypothetical protein
MWHPMTDDDPEPDDDLAGEWLTDLVHGGLPQLLLGKPASRAIVRLITAATDIPAEALRNVVQRIKDDRSARHQVCMALAAAAAKRAKQNPELVESAMRRWTPADARKQSNREDIAAKVLEDLADNPPEQDAGGPTDDFMNLFEEVAEKASSEELRSLIARVLAGELRKPASFSLRTLQFLSIMDHSLAAAVQRAKAWVTRDIIPLIEAMTKGEAYATLTLLQDVSVIRSGNHAVTLPFDETGLLWLDYGPVGIQLHAEPNTVLAMVVVPLTTMGCEVMSLILPDRDDDMVRQIAMNLSVRVNGLLKAEFEEIQKRTASEIWGDASGV